MSDPKSISDHNEGHRERLRSRFLSEHSPLASAELLELLLTYAVPRKNVAPLAEALLIKFGTIPAILGAPTEELLQVNGVGESVAAFLRVIQAAIQSDEVGQTPAMKNPKEEKEPASQLPLFIATPPNSQVEDAEPAKEKSMRVFANDEIQNALDFLPKAANFTDLDAFKNHLEVALPYNSAATRSRRANMILERFFPSNRLDSPLTHFAAHCATQADLKTMVFYHTLKAEPIAARVAEELIWPALPMGRVDREQIREFSLRYLPNLSDSSQKNMLRSLFYTYQLCGVGTNVKESLRFNLHSGTFESFLYVLTSEYPRPGIYTFESLYAGPLHHWLLWDREWLRRQLYNLRDLNIVSKIAEIDTLRQFTLDMDQETALKDYFSAALNKQHFLREEQGEMGATGFDPAEGEKIE